MDKAWEMPSYLILVSACDGVCHLTRAFEDAAITHIEGRVEIIHKELQLKDEEMMGPTIDKLGKVYGCEKRRYKN